MCRTCAGYLRPSETFLARSYLGVGIDIARCNAQARGKAIRAIKRTGTLQLEGKAQPVEG